MARAYFKCHECSESVEVYASNRKEADRLADYRTRTESLCHDCWSKQRDAQRAEASQQAAETAALTGLPVLQGTEKQVTWAETIRATKLKQLDAARILDELKIPPGNRLEALKGDRKGLWSIRINDQWRICFRWTDGDAHEVEIVDYH